MIVNCVKLPKIDERFWKSRFYNAKYFSFCQSKSPDITVSKEDITILFTSNHEEAGKGAQCIAECVEGEEEDLQSSTTATLPTTNGKNVNVKY